MRCRVGITVVRMMVAGMTVLGMARPFAMTAFGVTVVILLAVTDRAGAETWIIHPDGSGDFPTIQAAIEGSQEGDILCLGDGVFTGPGNQDLDPLGKIVEIRSLSGDAGRCVVDGGIGGTGRALITRNGEEPDTVFDSITFRGRADVGGAVRVGGASSPTFVDCVFDAAAADSGGAVLCDFDTGPVFIDCVFTGNEAGGSGGAVLIRADSTPLFSGCRFEENRAGSSGGAICLGRGAIGSLDTCDFRSNTAELGGAIHAGPEATLELILGSFVENSATGSGGAVFVDSAESATLRSARLVDNQAPVGGAIASRSTELLVHRSTLAFNRAPTGAGLALTGVSSKVRILQCIVAFNRQGAGVAGDALDLQIACTDIFGNEGGDWEGSLGEQLELPENIALDPRFCDGANRDLRLAENSPCLGSVNDCGRMGAVEAGLCGVNPVHSLRWGRLKARFSRRWESSRGSGTGGRSGPSGGSESSNPPIEATP